MVVYTLGRAVFDSRAIHHRADSGSCEGEEKWLGMGPEAECYRVGLSLGIAFWGARSHQLSGRSVNCTCQDFLEKTRK